ncbi:SGNH/GDSL hydrolase family protein [Bacteroidota bacterium]
MATRRNFIKAGILGGGLTMMGIPVMSIAGKKVALIGDYIRAGYQGHVEYYLGERAKVWVPETELLDTVTVLRHAFEWFKKNKWDIIHINSGHMDVRSTGYSANDHLVPPDYYRSNIEKIIKLIHRYTPRASIIWATTTPVIEELAAKNVQKNIIYAISNKYVIQYNDIAREIMRKLSIPVNDLYEFVLEGDRKTIMQEDGVQFTDYGNELLAEQVTTYIEQFL